MFPDWDPRRDWDRAFMYSFFKNAVQQQRQVLTRNWRREKSIYFAFSIVSSVGYGDFVVTTDESKWIIIIMAIPYIAIFAYALTELAQILIAMLTSCLTAAHARYESEISRLDQRKWTTLCDRLLIEGGGTLQGSKRVQKSPTSKAHISVVFHSFWLIFGRVSISRRGLEA